MKTVYDADKVQQIESDILTLNHEVAKMKIAKQQVIDNYIKKSQWISQQLKNLLSINDGLELSVLLNQPQARNSVIIKCWVIDYLIKHDITDTENISLVDIATAFKYEMEIKQQDFYL